MVTAYALAFGSLLLPGGRLANLLGRKVTFLTEFQEAKTVVHAIPPLQG